MKGNQQEACRAGEGGGRGAISVSLPVAMMKFPDKRHFMELGIQLDLKFHAIYFAGKPGGRSLKHVGTATVESRERINDACYPANSPRLEHQD